MAKLLPQIHFKFRKQVGQMYGGIRPHLSPRRLFKYCHAALEKMEIDLLTVTKEMKNHHRARLPA